MSAIRPIAFLLGTLAVILSAPTGQAQTFPKAGEVLRDSLGARVWQIGYRMTPTGYATLERSRDTQLSMRYAYWDSEGLNAPFEGEGGERLRIEASGYGVQKDKSIYCASASFSTGTLRRSSWNDVCDVWMLYPYTVADATGGDYLDEEYFLSGGYARYFGTHVLGLRVEHTGSPSGERTPGRKTRYPTSRSTRDGAFVWAGGIPWAFLPSTATTSSTWAFRSRSRAAAIPFIECAG